MLGVFDAVGGEFFFGIEGFADDDLGESAGVQAQVDVGSGGGDFGDQIVLGEGFLDLFGDVGGDGGRGFSELTGEYKAWESAVAHVGFGRWSEMYLVKKFGRDIERCEGFVARANEAGFNRGNLHKSRPSGKKVSAGAKKAQCAGKIEASGALGKTLCGMGWAGLCVWAWFCVRFVWWKGVVFQWFGFCMGAFTFGGDAGFIRRVRVVG